MIVQPSAATWSLLERGNLTDRPRANLSPRWRKVAPRWRKVAGGDWDVYVRRQRTPVRLDR